MTEPGRHAQLPGFAEPWGGTSHLSYLDGPTHWVDFGGPAGGTPIVLIHGLGGSHLNWVQIAPALARRTRTVALDLAGFGLTGAAAPRRATVRANAALLDRFIREVTGGPAVLVGNSMGGMISLIEASRSPDSVAGVVLLDASLPVPRHLPDVQVLAQFILFAVPFFGLRLLILSRRRVSDRELVQRLVDLCFANPSLASEVVLDAATGLAEHRRGVPGQEAAFLEAARSLMQVLARPRWYWALMAKVRAPVLLIHGAKDRLVPVRAARNAAAAHPSWECVILPDIGHTPQLECPDVVLEHLIGWLDRHELIPAEAGPDGAPE